MFGFGVKAWQNGIGSPRSVTSPVSSPAKPDSPGSIDTRAPFESVKAAVSLFGDVISPKARPVTKKTKAEEQRLVEKETQHHVVIRELEYYKEKFRAIDAAKAQASRDLNQANRTLQELTNKLETLCESKQSSIQDTEEAKRRTQELEEQKSMKAKHGVDSWKIDVDTEREGYKASAGELIASKQELTNLRQDFDAALEAKIASFQEQEDAQQAKKKNLERKGLLSNEVESLREMLSQVTMASLKAEDEHLMMTAEKEVYVLVHNSAREAGERELKRLREATSGPVENIDAKLEEANGAIELLREQLNEVRTFDLNSLEEAVSELELNKREYEKIVEEKNSIQENVESLRIELEDVRRRHAECKERALESEGRLEEIRQQLESKKTELNEAKSVNVWEEMRLKFEKLTGEAEKDRLEAEEIYKEVEMLRKETEAANIAAREADEKLQVALQEVEAAKAAEKLAGEKIHDSPRDDAIDQDNGGGSLRKIRLTDEEFEAMKKKIEDFKLQGCQKVAILKEQLEVIAASEKEMSRQVESVTKEGEDLQMEIEDAVKRAEMSEGAKKVVEAELEKWREEVADEEAGEPF